MFSIQQKQSSIQNQQLHLPAKFYLQSEQLCEGTHQALSSIYAVPGSRGANSRLW